MDEHQKQDRYRDVTKRLEKIGVVVPKDRNIFTVGWSFTRWLVRTGSIESYSRAQEMLATMPIEDFNGLYARWSIEREEE